MEFTSRLCLIGSAALGLILLVWGVFELDYSIVGLGYCFSGFDKMLCGGGGGVCMFVCMCVFFNTESAETTDSPTGAPSKSLRMQIKNATINVAKEQGGHAGFMAPSAYSLPTHPSLSLSPPSFSALYVSPVLAFLQKPSWVWCGLWEELEQGTTKLLSYLLHAVWRCGSALCKCLHVRRRVCVRTSSPV